MTRLALIALAAIAVNALLRPTATAHRRHRTGAAGRRGIGPQRIVAHASQYHDHHRSRAALNATLLPELREAVGKGHTAFFVSPDGVYNDYLVNYLAPTVGFTTTTPAGTTRRSPGTRRPRPIADLAKRDAGADQVLAALRSRAVSVVVPRISIFNGTPTNGRQANRVVKPWCAGLSLPFRADRRLSVRRYRWFATLRSAADSNATMRPLTPRFAHSSSRAAGGPTGTPP